MNFYATALALTDFVGWIATGGLLLAAANYAYVLFWHVLCPPAPRTPDATVPDADLPHVLVQIPMFNEAAVAEAAARSAVALDWPREKRHVQLLDDSTDATTQIVRNIVARLCAEGHDIVHIHRHDRAGFKAGALAAGLAANDAPYVAVLDADFRAPTDWLRITVAALLRDPGLGFSQSRCDFRNGDANALTRVQRLMQDAHYVVEQSARHSRGVPFQCNGTATVWRRAAIDAAGGWSGDTLSEDLDLGLRVFLRGWRALLLLEPPALGEMPSNVADWRVQQSRWSSGFLQVARKLLPAVWSSSLSLEAKISTSLMILVQLFFPCALLAGAALLAGTLLRESFTPYIAPVAIGAAIALAILVGMTLPAYRALRRGSPGEYLAVLVQMPGLMLHLGLANSIDMLGAAIGRRRGFVVTPKQGH